MTNLLAPLLAGAILAAPQGAAACFEADPALIWSACAEARADLVLLPEDAGATPLDAIDVTGAYTATDTRKEGRPKPVGLFVRRGEVVSREYARFDGLLLIDREGRPSIQHRHRAEIGGRVYDLDDASARATFIEVASKSSVSLLQSHLLIAEGAVDAKPLADAPRFRRRILFVTEAGAMGLWDSGLAALTLNEAAEMLAAKYRPRMALNLDMGSYDFCRTGDQLCGLLPPEQTGKLSNLLRLWR